MPYRPKYLEKGTRFGSWTVVDETRAGAGRSIRRIVICRCDCGLTKRVFYACLKDGSSRSCGCMHNNAPRIPEKLKGLTPKELANSRTYKYKYGIDLVDKRNMELAQFGLCAICKQEKPLVVDHNHSTEEVRKLLCNQCNHGLGSFYDNPEWLREAADYIEEHSHFPSPDRPHAELV